MTPSRCALAQQNPLTLWNVRAPRGPTVSPVPPGRAGTEQEGVPCFLPEIGGESVFVPDKRPTLAQGWEWRASK